MGQIQIIEKLNNELASHSSDGLELSEKDVVYVLVELRKLIDHQKISKSFPVIKFYADWSVHVRKDYVPKELKDLLSSIDNLDEFVSMENLRAELVTFLTQNDVLGHFDNDSYWSHFRNNLINILSEQPLEVDLPVQSVLFRTTENGHRVECTYS